MEFSLESRFCSFHTPRVYVSPVNDPAISTFVYPRIPFTTFRVRRSLRDNNHTVALETRKIWSEQTDPTPQIISTFQMQEFHSTQNLLSTTTGSWRPININSSRPMIGQKHGIKLWLLSSIWGSHDFWVRKWLSLIIIPHLVNCLMCSKEFLIKMPLHIGLRLKIHSKMTDIFFIIWTASC